MASYFIRTPTEADILSLAPRLRPEDKAEIWAAAGLDPLTALRHCTDEHALCGGLVNGPVEVIFGVTPTPVEGLGLGWLLGTQAIEEHPLTFHRASVKMLRELSRKWDFITNFVDARNAVHIHWLKRLGFIMVRTVEQFGPESRPFIDFIRINK